MNDIEQQRLHFEKVSSTYFHARQHQNHLMLKKLIWDHFFQGKDELRSHCRKVLEPMCGYSEGKLILESFSGAVFDYTGFDYSRPLVEEAKTRHPECNIFVSDVTKFEGKEKYDLVILIGGLHHVFSHTADVLARLHNALTPGGYFINLEPTQDNFVFKRIRDRIYEKNELFDADTERAFDLDDLNKRYLEAGFTVVDQMYPGLLTYVMYYNPDAFPGLNIGNTTVVSTLFSLERHFYRSWIARKLSFATLSLLRRD
jgi:SAM-dependent methyltransferase